MEQKFEWNDSKAALNRRKHEVTFEEARTVFFDNFVDIAPDPQHSDDEERFRATGLSDRNRLLAVIFTEQHETIRIISARKATAPERAAYRES